MSRSRFLWKYEFLSTRGGSPGDFVVVGGSDFGAADLTAVKSFLAGVVTNIEVNSSVQPNAIRLIDPSGDEIWRALIAGPRPRARRRPVHQIHARFGRRLGAPRKWRDD